MIEDGYSICLNRWALDPRIKNELPLLLIISTLVAKTGVCYAKNRFFADMFGIDETNVSKKIKKLIECGYIEIAYKKRGAEIVNRQIRLAKLPTDDWQNYQPTIGKITKGNNNIFKNNIFKNIGEPEKKEFQRTVYLDKKIQVGWDFKINFKDEYFEPYRHASKKLAKDVEQWIIKNKCGETITKNFVCRQLLNFAKKQGCVKQLAGEKQ